MKKIGKIIIAGSIIGIGTVAVMQTNIFPKNFIAANIERFHQTPNENEILASGNVEVTEINVGFTLAGRISGMFAQEGQTVAQGDKLATLDNAEMTSLAQQNNAALYEALARLEELKTGSRKQDVGQARANVTAVAAQLDKAEKDFRRAEALYSQKLIPASQLDAAKSAYDAAAAQHAQAAEKLSLVKEGATKETIRAAEYRVEQAKAGLAASEERLKNTEISAPMAGVVLSKNAEIGEIIGQGVSVYTLGDLDHPWIKVYVKEDKLGQVKLGQTVEVMTDSFPNKIYDGTITHISSKAEFTPKTVQTKEERVKLVFAIKVSVNNPNGEFKPGMPADVRIALN